MKAFRQRRGIKPTFIGPTTTTTTGTAGELFVMSYLVGAGLQVFWNVSRVGPADLVAWRAGGIPVLLDVKINQSGVYVKKPSITSDGVHLVWVQDGQICLTPEAKHLLGLD